MGYCFLFDLRTCHDFKIVFRLLCSKRRRGTIDAAKILEALPTELKVFEGFRERCYRLVYEHGDVSAKVQNVETILPNGDVEVEKKFHPTRGKGLMSFGYPKEIHKKDASRHIRRRDGPSPCIHNDETPESCAYPLVQTWTVNINQNFKNDYDIKEVFKFDITKVDEYKDIVNEGFHLDAIHAFYRSMEKRFGSAVQRYPIKCCKMKQENRNPHLVIVGKRSVL